MCINCREKQPYVIFGAASDAASLERIATGLSDTAGRAKWRPAALAREHFVHGMTPTLRTSEEESAAEADVLPHDGRILPGPALQAVGESRGFWEFRGQLQQIGEQELAHDGGLGEHVGLVLFVQADAPGKTATGTQTR